MRRNVFQLAAMAIIAGFLIAMPPCAGAGVNINVNLGPPPITVAEPPALVLVPATGVYFVPGISFDVFYYGGYWWSPRGERWYRARNYDGPWRGVSRSVVPGPVYRVPRDYREVYAHERHIPYGQWKKEHRHGGGHGHGKKHDDYGRGHGHEGKGHGHGHGDGGNGKGHGHGDNGKGHGHGRGHD